MPEDTRALLRQLLTSPDQLGLLAQVEANLESLGTLVTILLGIFGAAVVIRTAPVALGQAAELGPPVRERIIRPLAERIRDGRGWILAITSRFASQPPIADIELITPMMKEPDSSVGQFATHPA